MGNRKRSNAERDEMVRRMKERAAARQAKQDQRSARRNKNMGLDDDHDLNPQLLTPQMQKLQKDDPQMFERMKSLLGGGRSYSPPSASSTIITPSRNQGGGKSARRKRGWGGRGYANADDILEIAHELFGGQYYHVGAKIVDPLEELLAEAEEAK